MALSTDIPYLRPGDALRQLAALRESTAAMHARITERPDDPAAIRDAQAWMQSSYFSPAYFNTENVCDLFSWRGDIFRVAPKACGASPDWTPSPRQGSRKPRLGILASTLGPCAETHASLPYYEHLEGFDTYLFSINSDPGSLAAYCASRAQSSCILPEHLGQAANTIISADLDLLLVASNVTAVMNKATILASHRLARVQFTSAFSVVTTGLASMDYFVSGTWTDPSPAAQSHYREKLLQMEGSCHCFSYPPGTEDPGIAVTREDMGIAPDAIIYASVANYYKITPELLGTWATILSRVPGSVLLLMPYGPNWHNQYPVEKHARWMAGVLSGNGVSVDRLKVIAEPISRGCVRETLRQADAYLDSFPFSGTTSLVEPLEAGLPCVVMEGQQMRGAMGAAMLREIGGMPRKSEDGYIDRAVALGNDEFVRRDSQADFLSAMKCENPRFLNSRGFSERIRPIMLKMLEDAQ